MLFVGDSLNEMEFLFTIKSKKISFKYLLLFIVNGVAFSTAKLFCIF